MESVLRITAVSPAAVLPRLRFSVWALALPKACRPPAVPSRLRRELPGGPVMGPGRGHSHLVPRPRVSPICPSPVTRLPASLCASGLTGPRPTWHGKSLVQMAQEVIGSAHVLLEGRPCSPGSQCPAGQVLCRLPELGAGREQRCDSAVSSLCFIIYCERERGSESQVGRTERIFFY